MTTEPELISPMPRQNLVTTKTIALFQLKSDSIVCLVMSACVLLIGTVMHNQALVGILILSFIATSNEQYFLKLIEQLQKNIKFSSVIIGAIVIAAICLLQQAEVMAQASGGLFNPLEKQTSKVLSQAGATGAGNSILGLFGLMNILVAIAGIGAIVHGAFQQSQGHTLRESYTPLALVLMVYVGCSFVMNLFLGTGSGA